MIINNDLQINKTGKKKFKVQHKPVTTYIKI